VLVFRALALCLAAALAGLPLAPVEHVHRTDGPDGQHLIAHAHLEDHHHQAEPDDHHLATHVEDDDSVVLTLDRVFVPQTAHHTVDMTVAADGYLPAPAALRAGVAVRYQRRFIHGPPRGPTSLRAPPVPPFV
jgi:hypothetical protein